MDDTSAAARHVPNRGPAVFAVTVITLVIASVFVFARMVCRYFIVKKITWGDRIMMLAWLIAFFLSFTVAFGTFNGLGKYDQDIDIRDLPRLRRCEYVFSILYNPALMAAKTSILLFYLRLAKNTQLVLRYASWFTLIVVNLAGTVLTLMNIFQCLPIHAAWQAFYGGTAKCIPLLTEFICASPVNIVTDLAILALPIPVLTGMRLPPRQKTILILTFAVGIFVTIVDVVRVYYLQQAIGSSSVGTHSSDSRFGAYADFAYYASLSLMWSVVEVNVIIACACIPTLKPLVLRLLPAMLYDYNRTGTVTASKTGPSDRETDSQGVATAQNSPAIPQPAAMFSATEPPANEDGPMSAIEFITMPGMREDQINFDSLRPSGQRTNALSSTGSASENGVYFGFVNMRRPKSMLKTNIRESFKYGTLVSILFMLWGFSYGLLNTLNSAIAEVNGMSTAETLGLTSAYFGGGYFFGPLLVGEWILRRDEHNRSKRHSKNEAENIGGYKVTFILGLCIYGVGTIIFWPSAVTNSYGGYMLSSFVVGFGLSVLEVAANSFMVLCGPHAYGEMRLMLAQTIQGIGSVVSALLAQRVFFSGLQRQDHENFSLVNVQWTYLGITLLCAALGLFFYYMPLPEVSDQELEESTKCIPINPEKKSWFGLQLRTITLSLAVLAQYLYVATQESNIIWFGNLVAANAHMKRSTAATGSTVHPQQVQGLSLSTADYLLCGQAVFTVSRILAAIVCYFSVRVRWIPKPRTLLTICVVICFISSILMVTLRPSNPNLIIIPAMFFFFGEGPIWPLIFAMGLRGQGRRTKRAAAFITMGGSGPAFFPFIMYGIIHTGGSAQKAFIVIVALQVAMIVYSGYLDLSKDAKLLIDPQGPLQKSRRDEEKQQTNRGHDNGEALVAAETKQME
ncbi:Major facilitator superfamily domain, general substrate transporter [Cordyceps fumosorosea ARSEF 2679]|uniref:Major facilitator superfamily domain, general substrate transporter n=1 Tax=Cordyceps fumosorosea (strain ARSEF 2679) TaxID=1081104 RepID=A0A162JY71_CORFA|nr:Major facilitator superfamily domain, general substrate transporter [Cordyceps fumosorosea ARSEF 2679]OAA50738.1 Major facilitator superfamily domain, general substrate transporter [Cordyceps fumosorosea ARSEF 2679]